MTSLIPKKKLDMKILEMHILQKNSNDDDYAFANIFEGNVRAVVIVIVIQSREQDYIQSLLHFD